MGVLCDAVLLDAIIANRVNRLKIGRSNSMSVELSGCTFSTMYTWAFSFWGMRQTLEMIIRAYIGSVVRRAARA